MNSNSGPELSSQTLSLMLRATQTRIHDLENQLESVTNRLTEDVEAAELALKIMTSNFEGLGLENNRLKATLEELQDTKVVIKEEPSTDNEECKISMTDIPPNHMSSQIDKGISTDPQNTDADVKTLEVLLEKYHAKYKAQKTAKIELIDSCKNLEKEIMALKSRAPILPMPIPASQKDLNIYMSQLPKISTRPLRNHMKPMSHRSVSLKIHLELNSDPTMVYQNFLCRPGRLTWCLLPDKGHALSTGPLHAYDMAIKTWTTESVFNSLYGETLHLFHPQGDSMYYAGYYKALYLRSRNPEGSLIPSQGHGVSHDAIVDATIVTSTSTACRTENDRTLKDIIKGLYLHGILKVEYLGLQCVDFDKQLSDTLREHFRAVKRVGNQEGHYPQKLKSQSTEPPTKKRKLE